jgi:hypothetical protein
VTEDEIEQLIAAIEELLGDLELDAIVTQERVLASEGEVRSGDDLGGRSDAIAAGRSYHVMTTEEPSLDLAIPQYDEKSRPGQKPRLRFTKDDVRVTPLDARARLRNLLDLIEVATAGTLAMERFVHDEVTDLATDGIVFVDSPESELRGVTQAPWTLAIGSDFQTATTHAANVVSLLESLRIHAGVGRGQEMSRRVDNGDDTEDSWIPKQDKP